MEFSSRSEEKPLIEINFREAGGDKIQLQFLLHSLGWYLLRFPVTIIFVFSEAFNWHSRRLFVPVCSAPKCLLKANILSIIK